MLGKLLFRYLKTYRWLLLGVLVFQFASAMASLYLPRLNANLISFRSKGPLDQKVQIELVPPRRLPRVLTISVTPSRASTPKGMAPA